MKLLIEVTRTPIRNALAPAGQPLGRGAFWTPGENLRVADALLCK